MENTPAAAPAYVQQASPLASDPCDAGLDGMYGRAVPEGLPTLLTSGRRNLGAVGAASQGVKPLPLKRFSRAAVPAMLTCPEEPDAEEEDPQDLALSLCVRNTFIDSAQMRSPSLERFYREREVHSCPSSQIGRLAGLFREFAGTTPPGSAAAARGGELPEAAPPAPKESPAARGRPESAAAKLGLLDEGPREPRGRAEPALASVQWATGATQPAAATWPGSMATGAPPSTYSYSWPAPSLPPLAPIGCAPLAPRWVLQLSEALSGTMPAAAMHTFPAPQPTAPPTFAPTMATGCPRADASMFGLNSPPPPQLPVQQPELAGWLDLPSVGSVGHASGRCKPCAFAYSKGCENGAACRFCHLCGPGEKKRRQKEKQASRKAAVRAREARVPGARRP